MTICQKNNTHVFPVALSRSMSENNIFSFPPLSGIWTQKFHRGCLSSTRGVDSFWSPYKIVACSGAGWSLGKENKGWDVVVTVQRETRSKRKNQAHVGKMGTLASDGDSSVSATFSRFWQAKKQIFDGRWHIPLSRYVFGAFSLLVYINGRVITAVRTVQGKKKDG